MSKRLNEKSSMTIRRRLLNRRDRDGRSGFTILEILIATAILVIGLVGVLALFPAGIFVGKEVVEDSTAIALGRSVADSIRSSMRNKLRYRTDVGGVTYTYFIFPNAGVIPEDGDSQDARNQTPRSRKEESPRGYYYILLPRHRPGMSIQGATDDERRRNAAFLKSGRIFVYPESDRDKPNGGGDPFKADDDKNDVDEEGNLIITKAFKFAKNFPDETAEGPRVLDDQKFDVINQYSYAFSVRTSKFDVNMDFNQRNFVPGDELYHFRVMIFRSFKENLGHGENAIKPVFELDFEVAR